LGRSTGGASSSLSITMLPSKRWRRSISAAANPAAPPPTMTIRCGPVFARAVPLVSVALFFSRTNSLSSRNSTRQHATGLKAGARSASPVRRLKQA